MLRLRKPVLADFSNLPAAPKFGTVSAIGRLAVDEFEKGDADEVYLVYTDFVSMARQVATVKKLLPLALEDKQSMVESFGHDQAGSSGAYEYEPGQHEILDEMVPRFTALQVYQAVLESQASEHAARMIAMRNARSEERRVGKECRL